MKVIDKTQFGEGRTAIRDQIFSTIYWQTLLNSPESLPFLFPVFAVLCGDREEGFTLNNAIDWSLMPKN